MGYNQYIHQDGHKMKNEKSEGELMLEKIVEECSPIPNRFPHIEEMIRNDRLWYKQREKTNEKREN